jgi:hypothetical protein
MASFYLIFRKIFYMPFLGVEPTEEVDIPRSFDFPGERFALVILADIGEVVGVVAEYTADGERSFPWRGELVHAFLVLD